MRRGLSFAAVALALGGCATGGVRIVTLPYPKPANTQQWAADVTANWSKIVDGAALYMVVQKTPAAEVNRWTQDAAQTYTLLETCVNGTDPNCSEQISDSVDDLLEGLPTSATVKAEILLLKDFLPPVPGG